MSHHDDDLPTEYDVIVVGTGMTESIIAAAVSRNGKKVLHLDRNDYYGGMWASFNFDVLQKWLSENFQPGEAKTEVDNRILLKGNEELFKCGNPLSTVSNIKEQWFIPEDDTSSRENDEDKSSEKCDPWSQTRLKNLSRKFNLDLAPKLLYARGSLVDLLISSNIARYAEFRCVTRILTWYKEKLELVPSSRADVFASDNVSLIEKRLLMRLLQLCAEYKEDGDEFKDFQDKTFVEYLQKKQLTDNIIHFVIYAIAMCDKNTPCMVGVEKAQQFLSSLGRYGNTPFLWPLYGSGELPQCFCRLCAVFGGVYHLNRAADDLIISHNDESSKNVCIGIISNGQRLTAHHVVMNVADAPEAYTNKAQRVDENGDSNGGISRAIFILNGSIYQSDKEALTLLRFSLQDGSEPIIILEVGPSTHACPNGLYVLHMTCKQQTTAENDLKPAVDKLLKTTPYNKDEENNLPQVLWALYFNIPGALESPIVSNVPSNVYLTSGPDADLDFEFAVKQSKEIFAKMYPEDEFLPRAPDPEELILDDDADESQIEETTTNVEFQEE